MEQIKNRFTGEIMCGGLSLKIVLEKHRKWRMGEEGGARANLTGAILTHANLTGAYLTDADLARANLTGAILTRAILTGADLTGADLTHANLTGAYLTDAYLTGADLTHANLTGAYLTGAYLTGADLSGADLSDADLSDAFLAGAVLARADLAGAVLARADLAGGVKAYGHKFYRAPIQISDKYHIDLWDGFLKIGCERHLLSEWEKFANKQIIEMDGKEAAIWWEEWKPILFAMAEAAGRMKLPKQDEVRDED